MWPQRITAAVWESEWGEAKRTGRLMAVVVLVGQSVMADEKVITDPIVEKAVRKKLEKQEGELTNADLGKVIELNLIYAKVTYEGLKEVTKLKNLERLDLNYTQITDVGLKEVAKLQELKQLYLNSTRITDAGLKEVAKLQNLVFLVMNRTRITDEGPLLYLENNQSG